MLLSSWSQLGQPSCLGLDGSLDIHYSHNMVYDDNIQYCFIVISISSSLRSLNVSCLIALIF